MNPYAQPMKEITAHPTPVVAPASPAEPDVIPLRDSIERILRRAGVSCTEGNLDGWATVYAFDGYAVVTLSRADGMTQLVMLEAIRGVLEARGFTVTNAGGELRVTGGVR